MIASNRTVRFAFAAAFFTLLVAGGFSYRVMMVSNEAEGWVRHTYEVVEMLQDILFATESVKSAYSGYVLTGKDSYVDAYRSSRLLSQQYRGAAQILTKDNPEQQARFPRLDELAGRQEELAEKVIALRRAQGMEAASEAIRGGQSRSISDGFQAVIRDMLETERALLVMRTAEAARRVNHAMAILFFGTVLGLMVTTAAGMSVRRHSVARDAMGAALHAERERAQVTLDSIGDAVICTDTSGRITFVNAVAEALTGWRSRDAMGRPMGEVFNAVDAATRVVIPDPMREAMEKDSSLQLPANCVLIRRDGHEVPIEDSVAPIHDRDGRAMGAVIVFRDVSETRAAALRMTHSAQHDFLTGLPNRMLLSDRLSQAIALARRHRKQVAILYLDLDGFKRINDTLGHPVGDKLLQSVAERLTDCVRRADTVSRQGGDEFAVLLSEVEHPEDAAISARRMLQSVGEPHHVGQHELHVTTSIGVSVFPHDGQDAETLIKNADTAMYQAKEAGRRRYSFFKPAMDERAVERHFLEEGLRVALERAQLELWYQPAVALASGRTARAEAVLRWNHPDRGAIAREEFMQVAEDCGLSAVIGAWVLREACAQARAWVDAGLPPVPMAVSVTAMQFRDDGFLEGVVAILEGSGLDPAALELQLSEVALMNGGERAASILRDLGARGVKLAVDEFGKGQSSLALLQEFRVDTLKVDESLVRRIAIDAAEATLVTAVIGMAHTLGMRVIAAGVEKPEEREFLREHRCDLAQGALFGRPLPPGQFAKLLADPCVA